MKYLLIILLLLFSCDQFDNRLIILNHTADTIYLDISKDGRFVNNPLVMNSAKTDTLWDHMRILHPKDSVQIPVMGRDEWENHINKDYKDSILTVFVFDNQLIERTSSDRLIREQIYTKKFMYKVKDLKKLNWRIEYFGR